MELPQHGEETRTEQARSTAEADEAANQET